MCREKSRRLLQREDHLLSRLGQLLVLQKQLSKVIMLIRDVEGVHHQ